MPKFAGVGDGFVAKFLMVQVWVIEIAGQQARLLN